MDFQTWKNCTEALGVAKWCVSQILSHLGISIKNKSVYISGLDWRACLNND